MGLSANASSIPCSTNYPNLPSPIMNDHLQYTIRTASPTDVSPPRLTLANSSPFYKLATQPAVSSAVPNNLSVYTRLVTPMLITDRSDCDRQSPLTRMLAPLNSMAPAAFALLETVLAGENLNALFSANGQERQRGQLMNPFAKKYVQAQVRKLCLHKGHGANSKRRFGTEVDDIRGRYPELQRQTMAFCAFCVVLEWWAGVAKLDTLDRIHPPPNSALITKMSGLNFCQSEIDAVRTILYWRPRKFKYDF